MSDDNVQNLSGIQPILEARARQLARVPQQEADGESIEVVVVAVMMERYGIEIGTVSEIQPLSTLTPVPGAPSFWVGLVNLRSQLVPLLDLRAFLGLPAFPLAAAVSEGKNNRSGSLQTGPAAPKNNRTGQIVVVNGPGYRIGLLVDDVIEVLNLPRTEIGPPLNKPTSTERSITVGLTANLLTVLDIDKLLADPRLIVQEQTV